MEFQHTPVFFRQAVDALAIKEDGIYVDCTAGGGGHAAAVAERLTFRQIAGC
jgi:16S rRNA (cytosine1402-N4)-methyltransferase